MGNTLPSLNPMSHRVITVSIISVFVVVCVVLYVLFLMSVYPYNFNKIKEPMSNTWVDRDYILEPDAPNVCGEWCGGLITTPEIHEMYSIESKQTPQTVKL